MDQDWSAGYPGNSRILRVLSTCLGKVGRRENSGHRRRSGRGRFGGASGSGGSGGSSGSGDGGAWFPCDGNTEGYEVVVTGSGNGWTVQGSGQRARKHEQYSGRDVGRLRPVHVPV
jgi:hypothetical protein